MDSVKLDAYKILDLATNLTSELLKYGIIESTLTIPLEPSMLGKLNEDIFYRLYENGTDGEFHPSDEIKLNLPNGLTILFVSKELASRD